ncbi:MAG TPA: SBBP repeat-containing protein, partial [Bryobacteraceae bacterium]|nr:SBBP repeat-containing protein [Bryobacteraceae bacterium]
MKFLISLLLPATIFAGQFHAGPVGFEPNRGQLDAHVRFVARQHRCELSLTSSEAVVSAAERGPVRLSFLGANPRSEPEAEERLPGIVNYFSGNDPRAWRTGIPLYAAVRYRAVYPGIDVVYHGDRPKLEYDFVLAPGANPAAIRVRIEGAGKLELDKNGDLKLGDFRQQRPAAWQENDSGRRTIEARYVRRGRNEVGIELGAYDQRRPLVIDPVFVYATYLGGSRDDDLTSVATDSHGNTYVAGDTYSADFPTRSAYQSSSHGFQAAFVSKFDPTGALVYSTYLSGSGNDYALGVAADTNGYAYVTGVTDSANFPTTSGVIQPSCPAVNSTFCNTFGFVTKLAPSGSSLVYSTYFGGKGGNSEVYSGDTPAGIAVDGSGNAYITGQAATTNMPVANALQPAHSGYSLFESTNGGSSWQQAENNLPKSDLLSIAIDPKTPSTLYAAPLAGGFWKSTDGGHSWVEKDQGLTSSPIGVIAVDPVNPQNIYLGLDWASAPCGIYKSTDGANSWTLLNNGLTECDVKALAFNPQNTATIYAGVSSAKAQPRLFVSNDGGAHWSAIATNLPNSGAGDIHFLAIDPKTPSTMYAVAHVTNSSGTVQGDFLYKSTDSGATWIESDAGLDATIWSVAIDPAATSTIYTVNDISLYRSTDGGSTWTSIGNGLPVASLAAALVVLDPVTPSTMYVAAAGGLFKSTDSGANFTPLAPAQVNSPSLEGLLVNPQNTSILYAAVGIQPDAFVAELNATGSKLVYSTYLGGSDTDLATAIAVDAGGEAYVTGFTISDNFPVAHALYPTRNGSGATGNVFVTKLSTGATQLLWSTYFGGTQGPNGRVGSSFSRGIAVDGAGDALITGFTLAADFPVAHPLQPFLTGFQDAFVSKFASDGSKLIYSTYLGGSSDTSGNAIASDSAGNGYVTGNTSSVDFPLVNPTQCYAGGSDAFASTLKPDGSAL